jgi:acetoin utilization deacetylase AcuC-like enzyme
VGPGEGKTVNVPLPCAKLGDEEYIEVWKKILLPMLREFEPQLVIVSAGEHSVYQTL